MCGSIYDAKKDPQFQEPFLDEEKESERVDPQGNKIYYVQIHGGFRGTSVKFMICLPKKEDFKGHFFMHLSPFPGPDEEIAALPKTGEDDFIAFAITHGAGYVESNMGSKKIFGAEEDSTIFYRSNAAVAEYAKKKIREMYGTDKVFAYAFGGSGGGYKTMSCIENTSAFDGAVPFVIGSPVSLPNVLTAAANGKRELRHVWEKIVDALEPGGGGDPYKGLDKGEQDALHELESIGYPLRMCVTFGSDDDGSLPVLAPTVHAYDGSYFEDFWTKEGYEGVIQDGDAARDRIHFRTQVVKAFYRDGKKKDRRIDDRNGTDDAWQKMMSKAGDAGIIVKDVPEGADLYLRGVSIEILSGKEKGKKLHLDRIEDHVLIPGASFGADKFAEIFGGLEEGDELLLDNSDYIAVMHYHRHQVPEDPGFHAFDQYRDVYRKAAGKPHIAQRDTVISYGFTKGGCGSVQSGDIQGNVIVMNSLMDGDFPWQADWYYHKVQEVKGADAPVRLYYNDNCPHADMTECSNPWRVVSYLGMLRQALLDLADWTEKGILPPKTTGYEVKNQQVVLKDNAGDRCGLQPVVTLLANGEKCAHVKVGTPVRFEVSTECPEGGGVFESVDWSFKDGMPYITIGEGTKKSAEHCYGKPGTYFATARVICNRNPGDMYTRLRNLSRVRIVVE